MEHLKAIHKDFRLNGKSFESIKDLLGSIKFLSSTAGNFLTNWFDDKVHIEINTSGSSREPKLIRLGKQQMINSALATGNFFNLGPGTKALLCISTEYIAGKMMLVRALTLGWDLDLVEPSSKPLKNCTTSYDFSAMIPWQIKNSLPELHFIKKLIVGGGQVPPAIVLKLQTQPTEVFATFGMTETSTHIAIKKLNHLRQKISYQELAFKVLPGITISIDKRSCLQIEAPSLLNVPLQTNDVVRLVSESEFVWLGRADLVINSGGVKLNPELIESELSSLIKEKFFLAGIPDETLGEKMILLVESGISKAYSKLAEKEALSLDISKHDGLMTYQKPKEIYFLPQFIYTGTKKIQRSKTLDLLKKS